MKLKVKKIPWYMHWKGLLWQNSQPIFFKTRFGIHTFGMKYPIDVIILDNTNRIWKLKKSLSPNRVFFWNPLFSTVIELPARKTQTFAKGMKIQLEAF